MLPTHRPLPLHKRLLRWRWALALLLILLGGLAVHAAATRRALNREVTKIQRDKTTGIIVGAEALDIEPPAYLDKPTTACLLLHGFVGSRQDFADLGQRLANQGYHVRLARLPGHGTTPQDFARQTPESMLAAAVDEYQTLRQHYRAVDVIGFSMGGALATLLAAREDVHRLVLIAPYYGVTYHWYYGLRPETWNSLLRPVVPYVSKSERFVQVNRREAVGSIFSYHSIPTRGVATLVELGEGASRARTLESVRCPTLMLISDGDEAASPAAARQAFEQIASPQKRARWFTARSNHHLLWDYDAEPAKAEILNFLTDGRIPPPPAPEASLQVAARPAS